MVCRFHSKICINLYKGAKNMESRIKIRAKDKEFNLFFDYQQKTVVKLSQRKWSAEKKYYYYDCLLRHSEKYIGGEGKLRNIFYSLDEILDMFEEYNVKGAITKWPGTSLPLFKEIFSKM